MSLGKTRDAGEQVVVLDAFLADVKGEVNSLRIRRRELRRYPFDSVAQALWIATLETGDAILQLLKVGHSDQAYALARSIVETALNLRYITADRDQITSKTMKFIAHSKKDRELWLYLARLQDLDESTREGIERIATERKLVADGKTAHHHWSGERQFIITASEMDHELDSYKQAKDLIKLSRASDYYHPSLYVHASCAASEALIDLDDDAFTSTRTKTPDFESARRAVVLTTLYTKHIFGYIAYGMNMTIDKTAPFMSEYQFVPSETGLPTVVLNRSE